jgi:aldose 1-epimerase
MACRLRNAHGVEAEILALGATLRSLRVPDRDGNLADVVLGPERVGDCLQGRDCFGSTIGRYANRIAEGRFTLGEARYKLAANSPPHSEHGGEDGFDRRLWRLSASTSGASVECRLTSPDGDQGFPGALEVIVRYTLSEADELRIDYRATTTASTVVNLTNHTYWNLAGRGSARTARLQIEADHFLPVDATLLPTGELRRVDGTAFDFRAARVVGQAAGIDDPQLTLAGGYDHCFVLKGPAGALRRAASLVDDGSGRSVEILTTEPGLQLYTGNALSPAILGKEQRRYQPGDGIALETQHFPDSPNRPQFPSTRLDPGRVFESTTIFRFQIRAPDGAA